MRRLIEDSLGHIGIIANPAAQSGMAAKAATRFYEYLSRRYGDESCELALTKHPGHAIDMAAQAKDVFDTVIVIGGDGIVHEAINGLMSVPGPYRPKLGVVPVGSGNDYALTLGMPTDIKKAMERILDCRTRVFDVGCVNGEYFAETLSFGVDAAIGLDTMERRKKTGGHGTSLYMASGFDQIMHNLNQYGYKAVLEGVKGHEGPLYLESSAYLFAVQIGPTYGGHFKVCPDADPTDGYLDICIAHPPMNALKASFFFLRAKSGKHVNFKNFEFHKAKSIAVEFTPEPPCQADGEKVEGSSFEIECVKDAITVIVGTV